MNAVREKSTEPFVVDMLRDDNTAVTVYMRIRYDGNIMVIELEPIDELHEGQEMYRRLNSMNRELLGLHNDVIFGYDAEANVVKLFTPDFRRCTRTIPFGEFIEEMRGNIVAEDSEKLDHLITSFGESMGSFAYTFKGKILSDMASCKNSIVKGFSVSGFSGFSVVGYIHRGSNKGDASHAAERDALTGTYSKSRIANMARKEIETDHQPNTAICIIDIDYFKNVNDSFGHMMGDVVLKDVAAIIMEAVGDHGVVGRFGGDEFFVMFYDVDNLENHREMLRSIKNSVSVKYPNVEDGSAPHITLSIGCAVYPKDADNYDDLFLLADFTLYLAKDKGRNRYVIYDPEKHGTLSEIKDFFQNNRRIDTRKDLSMGEVLCMINDRHYDDKDYTPEMLVDDLVENLPIDRIICLTGKPMKLRCMSGISLETTGIINECAAVCGLICSGPEAEALFQDNVYIIDDIEKLKNDNEQLYEVGRRLGIISNILVRFKDAEGKPSMLSLEMTSKRIAWNRNQIYNYRTMARLFARYKL